MLRPVSYLTLLAAVDTLAAATSPLGTLLATKTVLPLEHAKHGRLDLARKIYRHKRWHVGLPSVRARETILLPGAPVGMPCAVERKQAVVAH